MVLTVFAGPKLTFWPCVHHLVPLPLQESKSTPLGCIVHTLLHECDLLDPCYLTSSTWNIVLTTTYRTDAQTNTSTMKKYRGRQPLYGWGAQLRSASATSAEFPGRTPFHANRNIHPFWTAGKQNSNLVTTTFSFTHPYPAEPAVGQQHTAHNKPGRQSTSTNQITGPHMIGICTLLYAGRGSFMDHVEVTNQSIPCLTPPQRSASRATSGVASVHAKAPYFDESCPFLPTTSAARHPRKPFPSVLPLKPHNNPHTEST